MITSKVLYRIGGMALALGGALGIVITFIHPEDIHDPRQPGVHIMLYFADMLVLLGLPAICARQAARAGVPGLLGVGLIFFGLPFIDLLHSVLFFSIVPVFNADPNLRLLLDGRSGIGPKLNGTTAYGALQRAAIPLLIIGALLLAYGTLRAGVLPRWPAIALLISPVALVVSFIAPPLGLLAPLVLYLSLGLFGVALIVGERETAVPVAMPAPTPGIAPGGNI